MLHLDKPLTHAGAAVPNPNCGAEPPHPHPPHCGGSGTPRPRDAEGSGRSRSPLPGRARPAGARPSHRPGDGPGAGRPGRAVSFPLSPSSLLSHRGSPPREGADPLRTASRRPPNPSRAAPRGERRPRRAARARRGAGKAARPLTAEAQAPTAPARPLRAGDGKGPLERPAAGGGEKPGPVGAPRAMGRRGPPVPRPFPTRRRCYLHQPPAGRHLGSAAAAPQCMAAGRALGAALPAAGGAEGGASAGTAAGFAHCPGTSGAVRSRSAPWKRERAGGGPGRALSPGPPSSRLGSDPRQPAVAVAGRLTRPPRGTRSAALESSGLQLPLRIRNAVGRRVRAGIAPCAVRRCPRWAGAAPQRSYRYHPKKFCVLK